MSEEFDPYHKWLGIPPKDQPPHHYRLLAIELFESDPEVIQHAADQRMTHLRSLQASQHVAHTQKLLSELAAASQCLLTPDRKAAYDGDLKARLRENRHGLPTGTFATALTAVEPVRVAASVDAISPLFKAPNSAASASTASELVPTKSAMAATREPMAGGQSATARSMTGGHGANTVPNHAARETLQGLNTLTFVDGPPPLTRHQAHGTKSVWRGPLGIAAICGAIGAIAVASLLWSGAGFWRESTAATAGIANGGEAPLQPGVSAAAAVAPANPAAVSYVDLADIVGGGNGFGTGRKGDGIDSGSGIFGDRINPQTHGPVNRYQRTASPLVDGVFVPDGSATAAHSRVQIASTGLAVTNLPMTTGDYRDLIKNGPIIAGHAVLNLVDFDSQGHSVLSLHANQGVTFDLAAIRKLLPGRELTMFTAWLGNGRFGKADFWVYVDGECAVRCAEVTNTKGGLRVQVPIEKARFLTFVSLDLGDFGENAIFLGDPRLLLDAKGTAEEASQPATAAASVE